MLTIKGKDLLPGDRIMHERNRHGEGDMTWACVCTVKKKPIVSPGAWSLRCEVIHADGAAGRISVGPTEMVHVERKGVKE
jgi:hypothetical protein